MKKTKKPSKPDRQATPAPVKIVLLPLDALTPYERNARKHTASDLATIKASIRKYGMNDPIGVWGKKNVIVEGHGRYLALKELGWEGAVPCVRLDHLTDEERRAYAIAHNRSAELSEWDFDLLDAEMDELGELGIDLSDLGFPDFEEATEGDGGEGDDFVDGFGDEQVLQDKELDKSSITIEVPRDKLPLIRGYRAKHGDGAIVDFILKTVDEAMLAAPEEGE